MAEQINRALVNQTVQPSSPARLNRVTRTGPGLTFSEVLRNRIGQQEGITFSAHALDRLDERNMSLTPDDLTRLSDAVTRAREKGSHDTLVLMDDMAMIVSVDNATVITAMTGDSLKENVFTNIDSTVIA